MTKNGSLLDRPELVESEVVPRSTRRHRSLRGQCHAGAGGDNPLVANGHDGESAATNLGPHSKVLETNTKALVEYWHKLGVKPTIDLVTTSGSGYDPDISALDATVQIPMITKATGVSAIATRDIDPATDTPGTVGLHGIELHRRSAAQRRSREIGEVIDGHNDTFDFRGTRALRLGSRRHVAASDDKEGEVRNDLQHRDRLAVAGGVVAPIVIAAVLVPFRGTFANTAAALVMVLVIVAVAVSGKRVAGVVASLSSARVVRLLPHAAL